MRYIQKTNPPPNFFLRDTENMRDNNWSKYTKAKKDRLKKHILEQEQFKLCCYCETRVSMDLAHIEHIKPKSVYPNETYSYPNLLVSCEGNLLNEQQDRSKHICGHKKGRVYDEAKFLSPTLPNIADFFEFETNSGRIQATSTLSNSGREKALYTINVLNLNGYNGDLAKARLNSLQALRKALRNIAPNLRAKALRNKLAKKNTAYISFLQFVYRAL